MFRRVRLRLWSRSLVRRPRLIGAPPLLLRVGSRGRRVARIPFFRNARAAVWQLLSRDGTGALRLGVGLIRRLLLRLLIRLVGVRPLRLLRAGSRCPGFISLSPWLFRVGPGGRRVARIPFFRNARTAVRQFLSRHGAGALPRILRALLHSGIRLSGCALIARLIQGVELTLKSGQESSQLFKLLALASV